MSRLSQELPRQSRQAAAQATSCAPFLECLSHPCVAILFSSPLCYTTKESSVGQLSKGAALGIRSRIGVKSFHPPNRAEHLTPGITAGAHSPENRRDREPAETRAESGPAQH